MKRMFASDSEALEAAVDSLGLTAVLDALADICRGKSSHIDETLQDRGLARAWDRAADHVESAASVAKKYSL